MECLCNEMEQCDDCRLAEEQRIEQHAEQSLAERVYGRGPSSVDLGEHYFRHVNAMTVEGLHHKSDIAKELAYRDQQIAALEAERDRVYESGIAEQRGFNRAVRNIACWALGFADGGGKTKAPIRDTATVFVEYLEGTYPDAFSDQLVSDNGACVSREGDSLTTTGESPTAGEPTGTTNGILERQIVEESRKDAEPLGNPAAPSGEDLLTPDTQKSPKHSRVTAK